MKNSGIIFCWLMMATTLLLIGCTQHQHPDKMIFRYNESSGIASLDPAFAKNQSIMWAVHQLYSTLVVVDEQLQIKPSVAKHWVFSDDATVLTFYLRDDVFFVDDACFKNGKGRKLVAADVVYSFNRIMDAQTASPGAWIFNNRVAAQQPFTAINDTTFQIRLQQPFQPILGIMSMQYCSIVPHEAVAFYKNDFRRHAVGSGPFKMVAWDEGQALVLTKNNQYFEKDVDGKQLPYLDGVYVSFYDSKATEFLVFQQGNIDFINDIDPSFKDEILSKTGQLKKEWQGKINLQKHPYLNIEYFGILMDTANALVKTSPLKIQQIRQAINYGIDKNKMMLYLRNSVGTAALSGFVPKGLPSFNDTLVKGYNYNPAKAKALINAAGFSSVNPMPTVTLLTIPIYANLANYIASELNLIGISIKVEVVQKSLLLELTSQSKALFFRGSWIADYPDAENYLSVFYSKNPAPPNYTRFKNLAFDSMYEKALQTVNDSTRYKLYQQMDAIIIENAPVVPLWYDEAIHLVQPNVEQFVPNSLNMLELKRVKKRQ